MKQKTIIILAVTAWLAGSIPPPVQADKPMHPAVEKLDLDGDFVLFLNTDTLEERLLAYIDDIAAMIETSMTQSTPEDQLAIKEVVEKVKAAVEWSGLFSLEAYAMSMAPAEGELSRVISVCQHAEADANKPAWRILGSEPRELKGIEFVPANAVYTANSSTSLDAVWKMVNEAVNTFGGPESATAFNQQMMMAQMLIGTNINAITESLENDILISLQFSDVKTVTLPQAAGTQLTFPEPSLLIGLGINNPMLGNILLQKLALAGFPAVESMHDEQKLYTTNLPIPSPVPLSPTLVMTDDYLLIGSTLDVVKEAIDSEEQESGLVATPLYKQLLKNVPDETSAIEFLSPRFMKTYLHILGSSINSTADAEFEHMMSMMTQSWANMYAGGYAQKTQTGFYSESYVSYGGAKPAELMATSYIGLIASIGIPSFQKARTNAQQASCRNKRRIIDAAKEQWALENGKTDGTPVTSADISEYIKGGFSALTCGSGGTYTINPIGTDAECSSHNPGTHTRANMEKVKERVPVARITGRQISKHPFVIDRSGFILLPDSSRTSLPLIQGLDLDLMPGQIESSEVKTALKIIALSEGTDYLRDYIQIESLDLKYSDFIDMRLAGDIRVRMPRASLKPKLQNLATVIKISKGQDKRVKEVDLTLDSAKVPVTYH